MDIRELASLAELESFEPEWRRLWTRDPRATLFQSPDWLLPWTRHLWGGGRLRVLTLRSQGRLCALAPFFEWGIGARCLSFLGSGISDYLDILAEPDCAQPAARLIFEWLASECAHCQTIDLQELPPGSPLLAGAGPPWQEEASGVCPVVTLPGTVPPDVRRAERKLAREASVAFRQAVLLDELFHLHRARWRERHDEGVLATASLEAFHRESAGRFLAAGMLRIFGLFANGQCIAVQYNFSAKRRTFAYLSGFDPAWSRYSPGAVLLKYSMERAIQEGSLEFDFLRRPEPFKYLWGARDRANRRLMLTHSIRAEVA
ncbi:MAG TPA: GNAT family N-acetyltransferase [Bryobacteraceae bacterium]|nr:GNAT family N-acetyltransferase [Bryobacteraceae bacterium]